MYIVGKVYINVFFFCFIRVYINNEKGFTQFLSSVKLLVHADTKKHTSVSAEG